MLGRVLAFLFDTPPWVFFTFFKLYKWYQIVQRITYVITDLIGFNNISNDELDDLIRDY